MATSHLLTLPVQPNSLKHILLILMVLLINSCANKPPTSDPINFRWSEVKRAQMLHQFDNMKNCCNSPTQIEYQKFPNMESWSFNIDQHDKAVEFDTGLSAIKAYRLPDSSVPYKLSILSHTLRDKGIYCFSKCGYMFIPVILFLDSSYMPLFTFLPGNLHAHDPSRIPKDQYGYAHKVKIEANNKAKYFVIYTTPSLVKNSAEFSFTRNAAVYSLSGTAITGSPFGQLTISIEILNND